MLSHSRAHFLRQVNGRPQTMQIFVGKFSFFTPRIAFPLVVGDQKAATANANPFNISTARMIPSGSPR